MKSNVSFVFNGKEEVKVVFAQNFKHRLLDISIIQMFEKILDCNLSNFKGKKGKGDYVLKIVFE